MQLGGFAPLPCGLGGGPSGIEYRLASLLQQRGTAYDLTDPDQAPGACSPVWCEDMATARALDDLDGTNLRLSLVTDPLRTCFLDRWERIYGIVPTYGETENARRAALADAMARIGDAPASQEIIDRVSAALGPAFVAYRTIPPYLATFAAVGYGSSTNAHVLVQVQLPTSWTEAQLQAAIAKLQPIMDWALPFWCTWDWYRDGAGHPAGGFPPDAHAGFYLDDPLNLDNQIFDA